jgi:hypothetical protein
MVSQLFFVYLSKGLLRGLEDKDMRLLKLGLFARELVCH